MYQNPMAVITFIGVYFGALMEETVSQNNKWVPMHDGGSDKIKHTLEVESYLGRLF
jgi:hypothetical protein